jgi:hypothetical protein
MARKLAVFQFVKGPITAVKGLDRTQAILAVLPDTITANLKAVFKDGGDRMVTTLRQVLPYSDLDPYAGALRASARREDGPSSIASTVIVDAKNTRGEYYAAHVEFGHKTPTGKHVKAKPAFYPVVAREKKRVAREATAAIRRGVKDAVAKAQT